MKRFLKKLLELHFPYEMCVSVRTFPRLQEFGVFVLHLPCLTWGHFPTKSL